MRPVQDLHQRTSAGRQGGEPGRPIDRLAESRKEEAFKIVRGDPGLLSRQHPFEQTPAEPDDCGDPADHRAAYGGKERKRDQNVADPALTADRRFLRAGSIEHVCPCSMQG